MLTAVSVGLRHGISAFLLVEYLLTKEDLKHHNSALPIAQPATFSKKIFAFRCMTNPKDPRSFTRKDKDIVVRGFISHISVDTTETETREEIHAML